MTEQERRSAIESLGSLCYHKIKRRSWYDEPKNDQGDLMHATINALRALHDKGQLNAKDVCEWLVVPHYEKATDEQRVICENAVQAMHEVMEGEAKQ
jgi:hypothetical protein